MKKEEKSLLIIEKKNEGKCYEEAIDEIETLESSQIRFRQLERQLIRLEKENKELRERVDKMKQNQFKEKFCSLKKEENGSDDYTMLKRLWHHMDKTIWYTKTDLAREFCSSVPKVGECLKFLIDLGKVEFVLNDDVILYRLK